MSNTRMILVGGFLGAGKTTLLTQAAQRLAAKGKLVAVVANDQAANLVDTGTLRSAGLHVGEVAGGCFCCRFDQFLDECGKLARESKPDIILGEPVGSCTDISATVLQPVKDLHAEDYSLAPFTVLADPQRLREALAEGAASNFPDSVGYIFRKQVEEADLIIINKTDTLTEAEIAELKALVAKHAPGTPVLTLSALTGAGVDAWLDRVLSETSAGTRITEVDYDTYADGEAVLGWLNATAQLHAVGEPDWDAFCLSLMEQMQGEFRARSAEVAHAKLLLTTTGGRITVNLTATAGKPSLNGRAERTAQDALLVINARVRMEPEDLRAVVERSVQAVCNGQVEARITSIASFKPGRPQPTHRYAAVVS
ncbi:MAG: GTP-binding protein [Armatimonadetes bacterium]|nr:GTP-binding protein [Armatimonadota bacterium]